MGVMLRAVVRGMGVASVLAAAVVAAESKEPVEIVEIRKIWDQGAHNAFTDLLRHDGRWYCVFREGQGHVSPEGALRVLTSDDGETWSSAALITSTTADLRDPKITVAPNGQLMLVAAGALHQPAAARHQSLIWYSNDGREWGDPIAIGDPDYWIWRITWHGDAAYGVGYRTVEPRGTRLYKSHDGRTFETHVASLFDEGYANESSLMFRGDQSCLCLLRRDPEEAVLGQAKTPFTEWTWRGLGLRLGGPEFLELPNKRIVVAGRKYEGGARTALWWLNPTEATLEEILTFPSGGDTSYPGLVYHDDELWVSYYSSHEGKTSIYLARVKLPASLDESK